MLTELRVTNFKGFAGEHRIPLAPVTLIFGSNSSGKTALLHALALLAENSGPAALLGPTNGGIDLSVPDIDLGGYRNLMNRHDVSADRYVGLGVSADVIGFRGRAELLDMWQARASSHDFHLVQNPDGSVVVDRSHLSLHRTADISLDFETFSVEEQFQDKPDLVSEMEDESSVRQFGLRLTPERASRAALGLAQLFNQAKEWIDNHQSYLENSPLPQRMPLINFWRRLDRINGTGLLSATPDEMSSLLEDGTNHQLLMRRSAGQLGHWARWQDGVEADPSREWVKHFQEALAGVINETNRIAYSALTRANYLGPMRNVPSRLETLEADRPSRLTSSGRQVVSILAQSDQILRRVNYYLSQLLIPYSIEVVPVEPEIPSAGSYRAVVLTDLRTDTPVSPRDLGFGITQLLPVLVALASRSSNLFLVEQPELHLHPRLHGDLASLFVERARASQPMQVIAETHSENLILRIQKMIRNRDVSPDEISIVYVGSSEQVGSWIEPIRISPQGEMMDDWPGGFFTERAQEWM